MENKYRTDDRRMVCKTCVISEYVIRIALMNGVIVGYFFCTGLLSSSSFWRYSISVSALASQAEEVGPTPIIFSIKKIGVSYSGLYVRFWSWRNCWFDSNNSNQNWDVTQRLEWNSYKILVVGPTPTISTNKW